MSQTIYHEIKAHIEPKINPTVSEDGTPHEKSEKQEHYNYHGNYSHYSPKPEDAKEGTPHKTYINQANKAIKNVGEYLENKLFLSLIFMAALFSCESNTERSFLRI